MTTTQLSKANLGGKLRRAQEGCLLQRVQHLEIRFRGYLVVEMYVETARSSRKKHLDSFKP